MDINSSVKSMIHIIKCNVKYILLGLGIPIVLFVLINSITHMIISFGNPMFATVSLFLYGISFGILLSRLLLKELIPDSLWLMTLLLSSLIIILINNSTTIVPYYLLYTTIGLIIGLFVWFIGKRDMGKPKNKKIIKRQMYVYMRLIPIITLFLTGVFLHPIFEAATPNMTSKTLSTIYFFILTAISYLYIPKDPEDESKLLFVGPRSSGKTILSIGLNKVIISEHGGAPSNPVDIWLDNVPTMYDLMRIFDQYGYSGIESTSIFTIHLFRFNTANIPSLVQKGILESYIELIDYRGEYLETISEFCKFPDKLENYLSTLKNALETLNISSSKINKIISDLKEGKFRRFRDYLDYEVWKNMDVDLIGPLYILSKMKSSNTLVYLIDGRKLLNYLLIYDEILKEEYIKKQGLSKWENTANEDELIRDLSNYATITDYLRKWGNKHIVFAVTKFDIILDEYKKIEDKSKLGKQILGDKRLETAVKKRIGQILAEEDSMVVLCNYAFDNKRISTNIKDNLHFVWVKPKEKPHGLSKLLKSVFE